MAGTPAFEEAIRLVLETSGAQGVEQLQAALADLGDVSAETQADTLKLVEQLTALNSAAEGAAHFDALTAELSATETKLGAAEMAAYQLSLALADVEKPTREMAKAQRDAREEVERQRAAYAGQWDQLNRLEGELKSAGVNTANLASVQRDLRNQIGNTAAALDRQAQSVLDEASAVQKLKQRMAEGDAQFKRQAESSRAAADALAAYKERAEAATDQTEQLAEAGAVSGGILAKLEGLAATALGVFSFGSLIAGVKSIVKEGSDAEQELGQLEATLASTGRQAEFTAEQLKQIGSSLEAGLFSGGEITNAQTRLLSYTNIIGEQYPRAMQVAIDQAQRLGISVESSAEIVGKALQTPVKAMEGLSKQGFVLEDSQKLLLKQLEATGRTAEAQAVILDLLVESYGGAAAAAKVDKAAGLWHTVTENFKDFQQQVADRGVLDYFKNQLAELLSTVDRLSKDGSLGRWAQQAADAIVSAAEVMKGGTRWVLEHRSAILLLVKAYAAFKIGHALIAMNNWRIATIASTRAQIANAAALGVTTSGVWKLGAALRAVPTSLKIGVALIGMDVAMRYAADFGEWLAKNSKAEQEFADIAQQNREKYIEAARGYVAAADGLSQYYDQQVLTSDQVAKLGEVERQSYAERLRGLKDYLGQMHMFYVSMENGNALVDDMAERWGSVQVKLKAAKEGLADLAAGSQTAGDAIRKGIGSGAQLIIEQLGGIDRDARLAVTSIQKLFEGLNYADSNALGDVGVALASISQQGAMADRNVRDGLMATLQQLSGQELLNFQSAAQAAFETIPQWAAATAAVLDTTLVVAMQKLGVSAERMGVQFTAAGQDATAAFGAILENANATSAQIEVAFRAALSKVATLDEARALGAVFQAAGQQGKVAFEQSERAAAALNARILQITNAMDPLTDEFGRLGITSQSSLNAARDAAKGAFDAIRDGASKGKASIEDVRRAMRAYGDAARASVADSDTSARERVESELSVMEAIYSTKNALDSMGRTGEESSQRLTTGAAAAADGLRDVASAANEAAHASQNMADSADGAAGRFDQLLQANSQMAFSLGEVGDGFREAMRRIVTSAVAGSPVLEQFINLINSLTYQREELAELSADLDVAASKYDEFAKRRTELREQFKYVSDGELDAVIQKETQIESMRKQRLEAREREAEAERKANEARLATMKEQQSAQKAAGDAMNTDEQRLVIDWRAPTKGVAASASAAEIEQAERLAELVAPRVLQRIERARSVSIARRHGR